MIISEQTETPKQHEKHKKQSTLSENINNQQLTILNFCDYMAGVFRHIFPDSDIAKNITIGCTYLKKLMIESVKKWFAYSLLFRESLCEVTQECERVVMVRYWDSNLNTAYLLLSWLSLRSLKA